MNDLSIMQILNFPSQNFEVVFREMNSAQLIQILGKMDENDLKGIENILRNEVKNKKIFKTFLKIKKLCLKEKGIKEVAIPKKSNLKGIQVEQVDPTLAKRFTEEVFKILNIELTEKFNELSSQGKKQVLDQMTQSQIEGCLKQLSLTQKENDAPELFQLLKERLSIEIDKGIESQLFKMNRIVNHLVDKVKLQKGALRDRVSPIKQPRLLEKIGRIIRSSLPNYPFRSQISPKEFLQNRVSLMTERLPDWSQNIQNQVLSIPPAPNPVLDGEIEKMRSKGAQTLANKSEDTIIHHLLGMTVTSTVVARSRPHLMSGGTFDRGGAKSLSTHLEMSACEDMLKQNRSLKGKTSKDRLSEMEMRNLDEYYQALKRGEEINQALIGMKDEVIDRKAIREKGLKVLGLDQKANLTQAEKNKVRNFVESQIALLEGDVSRSLEFISEKLVQNCYHLKPNESMFLDFGHYKHAMRISIKKTENQEFVIKLHDNSGGIENIFKAASGWVGKLKLLKGLTQPRMMTLQITVPESKLYSQGQKYFHQLFSRGAGKEYREDVEALKKENILSRLSQWQKDLMKHAYDRKEARKTLGVRGWIGKLMTDYYTALPRKEKWEKTITAFGAIAPDNIEFVPSLRVPDTSKICYARRLQTNQLDFFGERFFTKFGRLMNDWSAAKILELGKKINVLTEGDVAKIQNSEKMILSAKELTSITDQLAPIEKLTEGEHDKKLAIQNVVKILSHNSQKLRVDRRVVVHENDPAQLPFATFSKAKKAKPSVEDLEEITFVNRFESRRKKTRNVEIFLSGERKEIDLGTYLKLLKANPKSLIKPAVIDNIFYILEDPDLTASNRALIRGIFEIQKREMYIQQKERIGNLRLNFEEQLNKIQEFESTSIKRIEELEGLLKGIHVQLGNQQNEQEMQKLRAEFDQLEIEKNKIQENLVHMKLVQSGIDENLGTDGRGVGLSDFEKRWFHALGEQDIRKFGIQYIGISEQLENLEEIAQDRDKLFR